MEIWKDIPGYEGIYQASNLGRIKSLDRILIRKCGNCFKKGVILKLSIDKTTENYKRHIVDLRKDSKRKMWKVHQLIAMTFLNYIPCGSKLVVNHIDFNPLNNNVENLEIVTARENSNKKHIKSSSQYVGVTWDKYRNKWKAQIKIYDKCKFLGYFANEIDAHNAYQEKLKTLVNN